MINIGLDSLLPDDYVPTPKQRMEIHRQVHRAVDVQEVREVEGALRDRFGPPPQEALNLLDEAQIRILADLAGIGSIHLEDGRLHFGIRDGARMREHFQDAEERPRPVTDELAVLDDGFPAGDPVALAGFLKRFLGAPEPVRRR